jgi:ADP-ribose pyrophosphatase YjhB (NUDIX family)
MIWLVLLSIAFSLIGVPAFLAGASSAPPSETEAQLLARVAKEHDPVRKSKEETRLARIKLRQALQTYVQGDTEQGAQLVGAYLGRINDSWQILKGSGRNAARSAQGFKELDNRLLDDVKRRVSYLERDPIEKAEKEIEQVRAEVIQALFPSGGAP